MKRDEYQREHEKEEERFRNSRHSTDYMIRRSKELDAERAAQAAKETKRVRSATA